MGDTNGESACNPKARKPGCQGLCSSLQFDDFGFAGNYLAEEPDSPAAVFLKREAAHQPWEPVRDHSGRISWFCCALGAEAIKPHRSDSALR